MHLFYHICLTQIIQESKVTVEIPHMNAQTAESTDTQSAQKYPPLSPGTRVKTTAPNEALRCEWTTEAWNSRQWGVEGTVITHHDSHGLYYEVRHPDGTIGSYDPSELSKEDFDGDPMTY